MSIKTILMFVIILSLTHFFTACKSDTPAEPTEQPLTPQTSTVTDVEGNIYNTIKIGNKWWMTQNFRAVKTAGGQTLPNVYAYDNNNSNSAEYGRLYTWQAAVDAAPTGWHLPTKEEWEELINAQGGASVAGGKLKESGTAHWNSPNTSATNSSGLTAVGGGFRGPDGIYYDLGRHGSYWGTENNSQDPYCVYIYCNLASVVMEVSPIDKTSGIAFAVRYVKN
jgi:uncharacterized protein (TIGR02145 family)